jgi:hypothetical protein
VVFDYTVHEGMLITGDFLYTDEISILGTGEEDTPLIVGTIQGEHF